LNFLDKYKYDSFGKYNESWKYNIKIRELIKEKINSKFERLILTKNVISWILSRRNPSKAKEYKHPKNFTPRFYDLAKNFRK
jgi:hypothetical protein